MQVVLHSNKFHIFIVALIILDVLIVLFELFLDVGAFGELLHYIMCASAYFQISFS